MIANLVVLLIVMSVGLVAEAAEDTIPDDETLECYECLQCTPEVFMEKKRIVTCKPDERECRKTVYKLGLRQLYATYQCGPSFKDIDLGDDCVRDETRNSSSCTFRCHGYFCNAASPILSSRRAEPFSIVAFLKRLLTDGMWLPCLVYALF